MRTAENAELNSGLGGSPAARVPPLKGTTGCVSTKFTESVVVDGVVPMVVPVPVVVVVPVPVVVAVLLLEVFNVMMPVQSVFTV